MVPRSKQWIILDDKYIGIAHHGTPEYWLVDLVDQSGFHTIESLLVNTSRLRAVTKRCEIPAPRLRTMDPNWEPRP